MSHAEIDLPRKRGDARLRQTSWFEHVARLAFAAKGVLYLMLAAVTLRTDFHHPDAASRALLGGLGLGLVVAAVYKSIEAFAHPDVAGGGAETLMKRLGRVLTSAIYAMLALVVFERVVRERPIEVHWTARLLSLPHGPPLVATVGSVVVVFGILQIYRAYTADCLRHFEHSRLSPTGRQIAIVTGALAYAGRGVALGIAGLFLIVAARTFDAKRNPRGLPGALEALHQTTTGTWALTLFAGGMILYGLYCLLVLARFSMPHEESED